MIIAAIDVGTNAAMLLVAEVTPEGGLRSLYETGRFVRLGEGVDATRHVSTAAMQRLRAALLDYQAIAENYGATQVVVGATSASRDAKNQSELVDFVHRETGLVYEIISGKEEAEWSFRGALSALSTLDGPCAVMDIGGGSTEFVAGEATGRVDARYSLNIGSVRLTERFFSGQPPAPSEIEQAEAFIIHTLGQAALPLHPSVPLISAAQTPLLLALVHNGVSTWEALGTPHVTLAAATVHHWRKRLLTMTYDEVLVLDATLLPGRADVFPAAVLLFDTILRHAGLVTCRVSPRSLRHGLALRYLSRCG